MNAVLRAKLTVESVIPQKNIDGEVKAEIITMSAIYEPKNQENARWAKATPYARLEITINNPDAVGLLVAGRAYYLDFIPVEKPE